MMRVIVALLVLLAGAGVAPSTAAAQGGLPECHPLYANTMPCNVESISWVEAYIQGPGLGIDKRDIEKRMRAVSASEMGFLRQEVVSPDDNSVDRRRAKGMLACDINTVGGGSRPAAAHVECWLRSFPSLDEPPRLCRNLVWRVMSVAGSASAVADGIKSDVSEVIRRIAESFVHYRLFAASGDDPSEDELFCFGR